MHRNGFVCVAVSKDICDVLGTDTKDLRAILDADEIANLDTIEVHHTAGRASAILSNFRISEVAACLNQAACRATVNAKIAPLLSPWLASGAGLIAAAANTNSRSYMNHVRPCKTCVWCVRHYTEAYMVLRSGTCSKPLETLGLQAKAYKLTFHYTYICLYIYIRDIYIWCVNVSLPVSQKRQFVIHRDQLVTHWYFLVCAVRDGGEA